jgi:hypothetical protein
MCIKYDREFPLRTIGYLRGHFDRDLSLFVNLRLKTAFIGLPLGMGILLIPSHDKEHRNNGD